MIKQNTCVQSDEDDIRNAFNAFDEDSNRYITKEELQNAMCKLGESLTEAEIEAIINEIDRNGDGLISYEEFKTMFF